MIVFVDGNISSGKSTLITKLKQHYKVYTENIDEWNSVKNDKQEGIL